MARGPDQRLSVVPDPAGGSSPTPGPIQTNCMTHLPAGFGRRSGSPLDDGTGYYEVDTQGDVAAFGACHLLRRHDRRATATSPIVGMAVDRHTGGYWLVAADGGVFSFQRSVPWIDRGHATEQAGGRDDRRPQRHRVLAGRLGRRGVLL